MRAERAAAALLALALSACGGGGGTSAPPAAPPATSRFLEVAEVERAIAQAAGEARARGMPAHIVVVDRAGNVLAAYSMDGAPASIAISSGLGVSGGLDNLPAAIPAPLAALSKAITGAYLSSGGNAFSTRTAGQIIQEHFNPQELGQPSGPLYGVQFSQLPCSDVVIPAIFRAAPRPSPLGLSADPGGLPLYKDGVLVGGIGVEADGRYGLDRDIVDIDAAPEERIAVAGTFGFAAPPDIRADRITADGRTFRYIDSAELAADPARPAALSQVAGRFAAIPAYGEAGPRAGTEFGTPASGVSSRGSTDLGLEVQSLETVFYGPSFDGLLSREEVRQLLAQAVAIAQRTRAQIRRPLGSSAQVNIAVVERDGSIIGFARGLDAPVFGIDVSVQKARTALYFSIESAFDAIAGRPEVAYLADARAFLSAPDEFRGITAWSTRALGNLHRPFYPDGIRGARHGPLSTPIERWSPFNTGLQLDLSLGGIVRSVASPSPASCVQGTALRNGMQIFPGGIPIYRGRQMIGAIGVSGDGVDQDDMVAYLAIANASRALGGTLGHAPADMRPDRYAPHGARLRYVQCPQAPFVDSAEQNACAP